MEFTEKALVLKVGRFRENDVWLKLFCAGRGMITAFAFGGSRSRRRFSGCLDQLVLANFRVETSRRGAYNVLQEGELLHGYPGLRADTRKIGLVAHCLKFVEAVQLGQEGARPVFELLHETLTTLESEAVGAEVLPLLFKAKLTFEQGLKPDLSLCVRCGRPAWDHGCAEHEPEPTAEYAAEYGAESAVDLSPDPAADHAAGHVLASPALAGQAPAWGAPLWREEADGAFRGYAPEPGDGLRLGFSVERGGLVCALCGDVTAEPLCAGSVRVLEWIGQSRPADWPRLALEPQMRRELARVVDRFVAWHLGLRWENGTYRKI